MIATGKSERGACGSVLWLDTSRHRLVQTALDRVQYVAYARPPDTKWVRRTAYSSTTPDGKPQRKGEQ
jgi:hypothetical protein